MHLARHKIVHGDFKTGNILIQGPRLAVSDFGLTQPEGREVGCGSVYSRPYRPWELVHHLQPAFRPRVPIRCSMDMWAYGCVAWEILMWDSCLIPEGVFPWKEPRGFEEWVQKQLWKRLPDKRLRAHVASTVTTNQRLSAVKVARLTGGRMG